MSNTFEILSVRMTSKSEALSVQLIFNQSKNMKITRFLQTIVSHLVNAKLLSVLHVYYQSLIDRLTVSTWLMMPHPAPDTQQGGSDRERLTCTLQWRHNEHDDVLNHQPHDGLLKRLFSRRSKKTSKLGVTGLCEGNSPVTGEFPVQRASNAENVSIWWRHHV